MREKAHTKNISRPSCDSKQKASEASPTSYIHKPCEKSLLDFLTTPLGCHVLGARSRGEELLFTSLENLPFVMSLGFMPEESLLDLLTTLLVCHSEGSEESLKESLVAKRDSSVVSLPQNDNSGRVSSNSNRDSSLDSQAQNDKIIAFTSNSSSNASTLLRHNNLTKSLVNQIAFLHSIPNFLEVRI